jgi:hypothetical protein
MGLKAGWLALFIFVWLIGAFLGSTFDYHHTTATWAGTGTGGYTDTPITTLQYLMNISNAVQRFPVLGGIPLPVPNTEYFSTMYKVVTWQWSFLEGYSMFYWLFCAPFAMMGVLSLILLVYGIITGNLTLS